MILTVIALLQPVLSALHPGLAGWSPSHGHAYIGGMPVAHHHPYEETRHSHFTEDSGDASGASVGFTQDDSIGSGVVVLPIPRQLFAMPGPIGSRLPLPEADPSAATAAPAAPPPRL